MPTDPHRDVEAALDRLDFHERTTLPRLHRRIEDDVETIGRWRGRAQDAEVRARVLEAAIERVQAYATHLFEKGNTRNAQLGLHVLALIADQPAHTLIDARGELRKPQTTAIVRDEDGTPICTCTHGELCPTGEAEQQPTD